MGRTRRGPLLAAIVLSLASSAACGPDVPEAAELDERCGQAGPVRLLELPDEPLAYFHHNRMGERRLLRIGFLDETPPEEVVFGPPVARVEQWSVGECGESPRLLADDLDHLSPYPHAWPDVLLGCREETGELVAVDPEGTRPSNVVFRLPSCDVHPTPHGIVAIEPHDEDLGALVLHPWPDDPWTQTASSQVLLDPVRIRANPSHVYPAHEEVLAVHDDEILAITPDDELVSLSLPDGPLDVEATNARQFESSPDGRWLVWQDLEVTNDDEEWPAGAVHLRDRTSGTSTYLVDTTLAATFPSAFSFIESGILRLRLGHVNGDPERYWQWPAMTTVDLPAPQTAIHRLDDGRLLVSSSRYGGSFLTLDPSTGETRTLFDGDGSARLRSDGQGIDVIEGQCCVDDDWARAEGKLWSVAWDGQQELLAHRVVRHRTRIIDDRVITTVDVGEDLLGTLVAVDPETLDELRIDDRVVTWWPQPEDEDDIVYGVTDGDRSGIWLTKLAP